MSVKQEGIKYHFLIFGMTWLVIEPWSTGPLVNTLIIMNTRYFVPMTEGLGKYMTFCIYSIKWLSVWTKSTEIKITWSNEALIKKKHISITTVLLQEWLWH